MVTQLMQVLLVVVSTFVVLSGANIQRYQVLGRRNQATGNNGNRPVARIIGGGLATEHEYPWHVVLVYGRNYRCGGVMTDESTVLTAAHCVDDDPEQTNGTFTVLAGVHYLHDHSSAAFAPVKRIEMHELYDGRNNDIAVVHLKSPLPITDAIRPVAKIAGRRFTKSSIQNGKCYVTGFGAKLDYPDLTPSYHLKELNTHPVSNRQCKNYLKQVAEKNIAPPDFITSKVICTLDTHGSDCDGDSGGPLVCLDPKSQQFVLVGLVSWGSETCIEPPSVFTRVSAYSKWIQEKTSKPISMIS